MTQERTGPRSEEETHVLMAQLQLGLEAALNSRLGEPRRLGFVMVVYDEDDPDRHYYVSTARPKLAKNLLQHLLEQL